MLACKGIFAKPSITHVRKAHIGQRPKTCLARLYACIIPYKSGFVNENSKNIIYKFQATQLPCIKCQDLHRSKLKKRRREKVGFIFKKGLDFHLLLWYCCLLTGGVNNMDIINELWYGNVSPFEQCTRGDKRLKELLKLVARNREDLDGTLTEKQKETLEKFEDCMNEMHSITERDAFSYGFRLGVQLMAESFLLPLGEDEQ